MNDIQYLEDTIDMEKINLSWVKRSPIYSFNEDFIAASIINHHGFNERDDHLFYDTNISFKECLDVHFALNGFDRALLEYMCLNSHSKHQMSGKWKSLQRFAIFKKPAVWDQLGNGITMEIDSLSHLIFAQQSKYIYEGIPALIESGYFKFNPDDPNERGHFTPRRFRLYLSNSYKKLTNMGLIYPLPVTKEDNFTKAFDVGISFHPNSQNKQKYNRKWYKYYWAALAALPQIVSARKHTENSDPQK